MADCVAKAFIRLELFIVVGVSFEVTEANTPLLCNLVEVFGNSFWVY